MNYHNPLQTEWTSTSYTCYCVHTHTHTRLTSHYVRSDVWWPVGPWSCRPVDRTRLSDFIIIYLINDRRARTPSCVRKRYPSHPWRRHTLIITSLWTLVRVRFYRARSSRVLWFSCSSCCIFTPRRLVGGRSSFFPVCEMRLVIYYEKKKKTSTWICSRTAFRFRYCPNYNSAVVL